VFSLCSMYTTSHAAGNTADDHVIGCSARSGRKVNACHLHQTASTCTSDEQISSFFIISSYFMPSKHCQSMAGRLQTIVLSLCSSPTIPIGLLELTTYKCQNSPCHHVIPNCTLWKYSHNTVNLVCGLNIASPSLQMTNCP